LKLLNLPLILSCVLLQSCTSYSGKEISPGWYWAEKFLGESYEYGRCVESPSGGQNVRCTASNELGCIEYASEPCFGDWWN
jgi:hypothetical protein